MFSFSHINVKKNVSPIFQYYFNFFNIIIIFKT